MSEVTGNWWWWPVGGADGERPVLFFPPAGADQSIVGPLLPHVGGLRLGVLRLPGRGPRDAEPPPTDRRSLVDLIAGTVLGLGGPPPILVGHSFGGLLAYAVAIELQARGRPPGRLLPMTSSSPPAWVDELAADRAAHPGSTRADFAVRRADRIMADGGVPAVVAADPQLCAEVVLPNIVVDTGLLHDGFGTAGLSCPITVIRARDDPWVAAAAVAGWAQVTTGGCDIVVVPGHHFFYRTRPAQLATHLRMEAALS